MLYDLETLTPAEQRARRIVVGAEVKSLLPKLNAKTRQQLTSEPTDMPLEAALGVMTQERFAQDCTAALETAFYGFEQNFDTRASALLPPKDKADLDARLVTAQNTVSASVDEMLADAPVWVKPRAKDIAMTAYGLVADSAAQRTFSEATFARGM